LEPIEDDLHLAALADLLAAQAAALHRVFARAFGDILSGNTRSFRDVGRALRAQNQCRIALRLLVGLRAAEQRTKKSRNRTNELLRKITIMTKTLNKPPRKAPRARIKRAHKGLPRRSALRAKAGWSPERRAKQAELHPQLSALENPPARERKRASPARHICELER